MATPEWMSYARRDGIKGFMKRHLDSMKDMEGLLARSSQVAAGMDAGKAFSRFFAPAGAMPARAAIVKRELPESARELLRVADSAVAHKFDILGSGLAEFGFPIDWHRDIRSGHRWDPGASLLEMGDSAFDVLIVKKGGVELKAPWDLSNLHWLMTLSCAWHLSGDAKYLRALEADVSSWMDSNIPFKGVNWYCAMNVGMRALNIASAVAAVHPDLDGAFLKRALASLFLHGVQISAFLEIDWGRNAKRNNHYLSDLTGLFFLGILFMDCAEGRAWLDFAKAELELEAQLEFYPDGVCFEDSSSYHRLSTEMLLLCSMLADSAGLPFSGAFKEKLGKAVSFTRDIIHSDGNIPQFGDNDNGRMLALYGYQTLPSTDHRHILSLGGEYLDDDSMRLEGRGAESDPAWLLGRFKRSVAAPCPGFRIAAYPESGFFSIKDGGTTIVVRNGRISPECRGGHSHCDPLAFTMNWKGRDLFVDPASYMYSCDCPARHDFRSVEYHNTCQLGELQPHEFKRETFADLWWMADLAFAETDVFEMKDGAARFKGRIHSYEKRLGWTLERELTWSPAGQMLRICDSGLKSGSGDAACATSRFLLAPGLSVIVRDGSSMEIFGEGRKLATLKDARGAAKLSIRKLWHSPGYGTRLPALQIEARWDLDDVRDEIFEIQMADS